MAELLFQHGGGGHRGSAEMPSSAIYCGQGVVEARTVSAKGGEDVELGERAPAVCWISIEAGQAQFRARAGRFLYSSFTLHVLRRRESTFHVFQLQGVMKLLAVGDGLLADVMREAPCRDWTW